MQQCLEGKKIKYSRKEEKFNWWSIAFGSESHKNNKVEVINVRTKVNEINKKSNSLGLIKSKADSIDL